MEVKVKFRFNKATGAVEIFEIDDRDSTLPEKEHNREHDRIAAEIGNLVERNPRITEVMPGSGAAPSSAKLPATEQVPATEEQKQNEGQKQTE